MQSGLAPLGGPGLTRPKLRPDTKLPYKQRMRKVEMNKKEGNELVKDGASSFWSGSA